MIESLGHSKEVPASRTDDPIYQRRKPSRQVGRSHQPTVALARRAAALSDRPDHEALTATTVARCEHAGHARRVARRVGADVAALIERLELAGKKIAVERNGEIVPKSAHRATRLADGDRLEIVVAVGGG